MPRVVVWVGLLALVGLLGGATGPAARPAEAPAFSVNDVLGGTISREGLRGKRALISFMRDAGCPICELRLARLAQRSDSLKKANTRVVLIYESDAATMRQYLVDKNLPFRFVADPQGELYDLFGLEKSFLKTMIGFVNGAGKKIREGQKLQTQEISREEAERTRITADFVLDENGVVERAYYGRYLGDHMPL
jgi:thioredoxin-dependent peroxiredoxin